MNTQAAVLNPTDGHDVDPEIELSRLYSEMLARVESRRKSEQLGEAFEGLDTV